MIEPTVLEREAAKEILALAHSYEPWNRDSSMIDKAAQIIADSRPIKPPMKLEVDMEEVLERLRRIDQPGELSQADFDLVQQAADTIEFQRDMIEQFVKDAPKLDGDVGGLVNTLRRQSVGETGIFIEAADTIEAQACELAVRDTELTRVVIDAQAETILGLRELVKETAVGLRELRAEMESQGE